MVNLIKICIQTKSINPLTFRSKYEIITNLLSKQGIHEPYNIHFFNVHQ
jgi:hypothetical protein